MAKKLISITALLVFAVVIFLSTETGRALWGALRLSWTVAKVERSPQFRAYQNSLRQEDVDEIADAIEAYMIAHNGVWDCPVSGLLPTVPTYISNRPGEANIMPCIIPKYLDIYSKGYYDALPREPLDILHLPGGDVHISTYGWGAPDEPYFMGYIVSQSGGSRGPVTVSAPHAWDKADISATR